MDFPIGATVDVHLGRGVVRFCGATSFSSGKWVGIELPEPVGKNDGSVQGVSYFSCPMNYGVFVKASQVKLAQVQDLPPTASSGSQAVSRTPLGHSRTPSASLSRVPSTRSILPPSPRASSPLKPGTNQSTRSGTRLAPPSPTKRSPIPSIQPPVQLPSDRVLTSAIQSSTASDLRSPTPPPHPELRGSLVNDEELQELRVKVRVLEIKRADEARHVQELQTRVSEAESFVALRPKLQAKLVQQQTELIAVRRELADAQQLSELAETLAEERAEAAEGEIEELKEKLAVVEVELEVIKEGASEGGNSNVAGSLAYIQLEKQNARLKEALIRLRDLSQETEQEQRKRITEMEKDVMSVDDLSTQLESTLIKLSNADAQIEDLKIQLDDALGAEEMVVQLTERNLTLGEKIEEMRITIEDLEALKELAEELEENHVETERAMQDEINEKDVQLAELQQRIETLEEACQDMERTITRFRELVLQLESELETLRSETQNAQTESAAAASQTAAIMSLNLKLQSTATRNQARNIDHELKRIEANETKEWLNIVQPYLPQIYTETDGDATRCYLFFQRMASKTDLVNTVTAHAHNLPESLNGQVSETLVGVCEMRGAIAVLSTLCKRFAAIIRHCDVESFINIGRLFQEIAPLERRIDMHIDLLRRDEFREMECTSDINRIQAQFNHLADTYFKDFDFDLGERELGLVLSLDHDLDVYASSMGLTKTAVEAILNDEDITRDLNGMDPGKSFLEPIQKSLDQCKNAKAVARKLVKRLEELAHESSALKAYLVPRLEALCSIVSEMVNLGIQLAQQTMPHIDEVRASKSSFQLDRVLSFVNDVASSTVAKICKNTSSPWAALSDAISELVAQANALFPNTMDIENIVKITGAAPWIVRIEEVKAAMAVNEEAERKVAQLNEEMQGLVRNLKSKDQNIQESAVKIELMERRMEAAKKQAEAKQEKYYVEAMEQLQSEFDSLAKENSKLKATSNASEKEVTGATTTQPQIVLPVDGNLETTHLLEQATISCREIDELPPLPETRHRLITPPLDTSGLSDTDESDTETESSHKVPSVRSLTMETKSLYKEVIKFSSTPRVVDLSTMKTGQGSGKGWVPRKKTPTYQVWERKTQAERLNRRVQGLLERTSAISVIT
ncbi:dynein associated protein-domain-containing protein [Lactarius sanguifluus]|nr:dynein associated protein-domain-containing protein [Lactarius sanguifluus]